MVFDYGNRMNSEGKILMREILLGFWKVHILHHAAHGPVVGQDQGDRP